MKTLMATMPGKKVMAIMSRVSTSKLHFRVENARPYKTITTSTIISKLLKLQVHHVSDIESKLW
jgi:hypothetical protein